MRKSITNGIYAEISLNCLGVSVLISSYHALFPMTPQTISNGGFETATQDEVEPDKSKLISIWLNGICIWNDNGSKKR